MFDIKNSNKAKVALRLEPFSLLALIPSKLSNRLGTSAQQHQQQQNLVSGSSNCLQIDPSGPGAIACGVGLADALRCARLARK